MCNLSATNKLRDGETHFATPNTDRFLAERQEARRRRGGQKANRDIVDVLAVWESK